MCKHKPKRLREFEPILKANGYHEIRSRGSHFVYGNGKNQITVNKDLNKMVQLRLIKENNLVEVKYSMWQHIEFADGSNPYISKTEKDFKRMSEQYLLIPISENFWKATDRVFYKVVGFPDKDKRATFDRDYKSKAGAMNVIRKAIKEKKFEYIVLRKEIEDLRNDEHFDISVSTPIKTWNLV